MQWSVFGFERFSAVSLGTNVIGIETGRIKRGGGEGV